MKPIYKPTGRAGEYGDYAINIYTGCNHGCVYCYAAKNAKRWGKDFTHVEPRKGIVDAVKRQLMHDNDLSTALLFGTPGKLIHLCFTCDPYPVDIDTTVTRDVIKAIKESGNHVQILTKGGNRANRDFDLLDNNDWFGVTITGDFWNDKKTEPNAAPWVRNLEVMAAAHDKGVRTWVSCEPVLDTANILRLIDGDWPVDRFKIGKLNYHNPEDFGLPPIDWKSFGIEAERLCKLHCRDYMIKEDLRREMEATP